MGSIYDSKPISNKYDGTLDYRITMYDNLPYKRDAEFCGAQQIALYSGHVIKYYLCINNEDTFKINNHDDNIQEILSNESKKQLNKISEKKEEVFDNDSSNEITQEQIKTLLDDPDNPDASDNSSADLQSDNTPDDSLNNTSNAFEGVEDW
ncbi:MAG: hypothetical protein MR409_02980 [Lachnospiraceae bacterium]|nr:hypothetical protein [Lachnospiraceae bacterium]